MIEKERVAYCYERNDAGHLYKRTRDGDKFAMFPMNKAVIAYDSHSNYVIYTLMYEPLIRGKGTREKAVNEALSMQAGVNIDWEDVQYITRCGVPVTLNKDVHLLK